MATSQRKSTQIKISLTPELHERLREVAAQLGQAPATLAGLAVGQYVAQMSSSLGASARMVEAMSSHVAAQMGPEIERQMRLADVVAPPALPKPKAPRKVKP